MKSAWNDAEARDAIAKWGSQGEDLALRVYSSRLLGAEPTLVLHGGGNTSVKSRAQELTGETVDVLYVKGSGWDLASIEPRGFPACRLGPLTALCRLPELSDEDMTRGLQSQMLDPKSPTPSVEALLHAFLPAKFVDHTHADAVLTLVDQPDSKQRVLELFGPDAIFVPYVMPGFVLARQIVELGADFTKGQVMVLDKHGIFTWGDTAQESYERMIAAVDRAESAVRRGYTARTVAPVESLAHDDRRARQSALSPVLRGALGSATDGTRLCVQWRDEPEVLALLERADAEALTARGTVTPDHVIRIKPFPLFLGDLHHGEDLEDQGRVRARVADGLEKYRESYERYFEEGQRALGRELTRLDRLPRVVHVPGLGAACLGATLAEARVAGDLVRHSAEVLIHAERIGSYQPVTALQAFEVEYWSLEQAKLGKKQTSGALARQIAVVTGAASGIGLATCIRFLEEGAHVVLSDFDEVELQRSAASLATRFGPRVFAVPTDVTEAGEVVHLFQETCRHFGGVDVVVSNAGSAPSGQLHTEAGDAALRDSLELNLLGHQTVAHHASRVLLTQGIGGCLLFNASKSAFNPGPDFGPYAIPKAALVALTKQYAIDLGRHGVRASAVSADRIRTQLFAGGVLEARAKARGISPDEYFRQNLLGRETEARDVAEAFLYLARAEATTGAVITVDGGNPAAFVR